MPAKVRKRPGASNTGSAEVAVRERLPRPGNSKYDWEAVRRDFIEGIDRPNTKNEKEFPNLRELAELHQIPYERIRKKSAEERWTQKRAAAEQVYHQKRAAGRAKQIARNALDFDEKTYNAAKIGIAMVTTRLAEVASEVAIKKPLRDQAWRTLAAGGAVDKAELYSAIRADEINALANAMERLQTVGMKALGTDVQRVDISGGDTQVNIVNVSQEIQRDDPERLAAIIGAFGEAGMLPDTLLDALEAEQDDDDVVDGEEVPDPDSDAGEGYVDDGREYFADDLTGDDEEEIDTAALAAEVLGD